MKIKRTAVAVASIGMMMAGLTACGASSNSGSSTNTTNNTVSSQGQPNHTKQWSAPPSMQIDTQKTYDAVFHTNYGDFTVELFAKDAPQTVNNFVFLVKHHFYEGDKFFRIIQSFMIQTGDPNNDGTGGPGYQFADELPPKHPYSTGIVAMANAGPNTNGSQFFICTGKDSQNLNSMPYYTQFGQVTKGMDVVEKIAAVPVVANPSSPTQEMSKPTQDAHINSIDIVELSK